jgi:hypothetical protein
LKNLLFIYFLLVISDNIFAQSSTGSLDQEQINELDDIRSHARKADSYVLMETIDSSDWYFYRSYSDYLNHIPVKGIKYAGGKDRTNNSEFLKVLLDGKVLKISVTRLKFWGYTEATGHPVRIFEGHTYQILTAGKLCTYLKINEAQFYTKGGKGYISYRGGYGNYISAEPDGKIESYTFRKFQVITAGHPEIAEGLKNELDKKSETWWIDETFNITEYASRFNEFK